MALKDSLHHSQAPCLPPQFHFLPSLFSCSWGWKTGGRRGSLGSALPNTSLLPEEGPAQSVPPRGGPLRAEPGGAREWGVHAPFFYPTSGRPVLQDARPMRGSRWAPSPDAWRAREAPSLRVLFRSFQKWMAAVQANGQLFSRMAVVFRIVNRNICGFQVLHIADPWHGQSFSL